MVTCRVIDNAGVALAAINRQPVATARAMALAYPRANGATLFGLPSAVRVHAQWACWANATAVRELDFHDCCVSAAHPGDNMAPLIAVAQQMGGPRHGGWAVSPRTQLHARARPPAHDHRLVAQSALGHRPYLGGAIPPGAAAG